VAALEPVGAVRSVTAGIHAAERVGPGLLEIILRKKVYSKRNSALPSLPSQR